MLGVLRLVCDDEEEADDEGDVEEERELLDEESGNCFCGETRMPELWL